MNILITGGTGFLGSHLVERLLNLGHKVFVISKVPSIFVYINKNQIFHLNIQKELIEESIGYIDERAYYIYEDLNRLTEEELVVILENNKIEAICHLAAEISIPKSYTDPMLFVQTNTITTTKLFLAAKKVNIYKFIHTSTSETYSTALYSPMDENHPTNASSPYAASKLAGDKIGESFYKSFDFPIIILRCFNMFGSRQSSRAVIPSLISQVLTMNEIKVGNLETYRDFTFVTDTAEAFIKALFTENKQCLGQVINIGYGETFLIRDVLNMILKNVDREVKLIEDIQRIRPEKSEVMKLICDNKKARQLLEWEPKIKFEEGLKVTVEFIKNNLKLFNTKKYNI